MENSESNNDQLKYAISYLTMRKAIGILGIVLPFAMVIGSAIGGYEVIQSSISDYYYTNMRNLFVGILCAVGLFLFSYKGYEGIDNISGNLAGIFAFGIAFLPTEPDCLYMAQQHNDLIGHFHLASAALFFITIALISIFLFTKIGDDDPTPEKERRNIVYRVCGYSILASQALMGIYIGVLKDCYPALQNYHPVFWLEAIALLMFGISWLLKGGVLMGDVESRKHV